jgi:FtsZ-binding cell division protein ZapB
MYITGSQTSGTNTLYTDINLHYDAGTLTSTKFNALSDYRIKENISSINLLDYNIDHLNPVLYNHKSDGTANIGFLAHELQEYYPFLVSGVKDGEKTQSINYIGLIGVLTKEIQELKKDNEIIHETLRNLQMKMHV